MAFFSSPARTIVVIAVISLLTMLVRSNFTSGVESLFTKLGNRRWLAFFVVFFFVVTCRLAILPMLPLPVPGIHDEFSYLLMADTFVHGRLANPPHPMWMSFETFHVNFFPTYSSMYPPAQGFVLALGQRLWHPWLGVMLSDALMCAVLFWMLRAWMPARWAFFGGALAALKLGVASYWMNSYWGGAVAAIGGALVLGALPRIQRKSSSGSRIGNAILLGLGAAILANSRPYEGFLFALPVAAWLTWWIASGEGSRTSLSERCKTALLPIVLVLGCAAVLMGFYNYRLTGHPLLMPHVLNSRTYERAGLFLWNRSRPPMTYHNEQFDAFYNDWERENYQPAWSGVERVSGEKIVRIGSTFFWYGAVLLLPGIPLALYDKRLRLPLTILGIVTAGLFAVIWSMGHYAAPLLCVVFLFMMQAVRHLRAGRILPRRVGVALSWSAVLLLLLQVGSNVSRGVCDPLQWTCQGDPSRQAIVDNLSKMPGKHLVIVRYEPDHNIHDEWVYNSADLDEAKVLFARDIDGAQNKKLLDYYRGRQIWLVNPDIDNTELTRIAPGSPLPPIAAE